MSTLGEEPSQFMFLFLGRCPKTQVLVGVRALDRDSQLSWYCIAIGFPCCLTPGAASCKGDQTSPTARTLGPAAIVRSHEHVRKVPSPGSRLCRTTWDKAPLRVYGCPLVAARGIEPQGPLLREGVSQFMIVLLGQYFQCQVS